MRDFILRLFINAVALTVVAMVFPGIHFSDNGVGTLALVALILALVNAILKPIIFVLSCPLVILTFGLWLFILNGFMLLITDELAGSRFDIDGFWTAVGAGLVMSVIVILMEGLLGLNKGGNGDNGQIVIKTKRDDF